MPEPIPELDRLRLRALVLDRLVNAGLYDSQGNSAVGQDVVDDITGRLIAGDFKERYEPLVDARKDMYEQSIGAPAKPTDMDKLFPGWKGDAKTLPPRPRPTRGDVAALEQAEQEAGGHVPDFLRLMGIGNREGGEDGQGVPRPDDAEMIFGVPASQVWDAQRADGKKTGWTAEDQAKLGRPYDGTYSEGTRIAKAHTEQSNLVGNLTGLSLEQRAARDKAAKQSGHQVSGRQISRPAAIPTASGAIADFEKKRNPQSENVTFLESLSHPDHSIAHGINNMAALGEGAWRAWTDTRDPEDLPAGYWKPGPQQGHIIPGIYNWLVHHTPAARDQGRLMMEQSRKQRIIPKGMTPEDGHRQVDQTVVDNQPEAFDDSYRSVMGKYPSYALSALAWFANGMIDPSILATGPGGLITRGLGKAAALTGAKAAVGTAVPTIGRRLMRSGIKTAKGASRGYVVPGFFDVGSEFFESIPPAVALSAAGGVKVPAKPFGSERPDLPQLSPEEHAQEMERKRKARLATSEMEPGYILRDIEDSLKAR